MHQLLASVLGEARLCCSGQPVILVGDPLVTPSLAKGMSDGRWVTWKKPLLSAAIPLQISPFREFSLTAWSTKVAWAQFLSSLLPSLGTQSADLSRHSSSEAVQNTRDVPLQELSFVPTAVREQLRAVCINGNDVDASWNLWSHEAEASFGRAYQAAGEHTLRAPISSHKTNRR